MPFSDDQLDEAMREAFASAPVDEVVLNTLELRHPDFRDEDDNPTHLRIVANGPDMHAKLEANAPVDGGLTVLFRQCPFNFTRPEQSAQPQPEAELWIDNVVREMVPQLDRVIETMTPIDVVFRQYLSSRIAIAPSFIIRGMQAKRASAGTFRVVGGVGFFDFVNGRFPANDYRTETHRGLDQ